MDVMGLNDDMELKDDIDLKEKPDLVVATDPEDGATFDREEEPLLLVSGHLGFIEENCLEILVAFVLFFSLCMVSSVSSSTSIRSISRACNLRDLNKSLLWSL